MEYIMRALNTGRNKFILGTKKGHAEIAQKHSVLRDLIYDGSNFPGTALLYVLKQMCESIANTPETDLSPSDVQLKAILAWVVAEQKVERSNDGGEVLVNLQRRLVSMLAAISLALHDDRLRDTVFPKTLILAQKQFVAFLVQDVLIWRADVKIYKQVVCAEVLGVTKRELVRLEATDDGTKKKTAYKKTFIAAIFGPRFEELIQDIEVQENFIRELADSPLKDFDIIMKSFVANEKTLFPASECLLLSNSAETTPASNSSTFAESNASNDGLFRDALSRLAAYPIRANLTLLMHASDLRFPELNLWEQYHQYFQANCQDYVLQRPTATPSSLSHERLRRS